MIPVPATAGPSLVLASASGPGGSGLSSAVVAAGGSIGSNEDVQTAVRLILDGHALERKTPRPVDDTLAARLRGDLLRVADIARRDYLKAAARAGELPDKILAILKKASISVDRSGFNDPEVYAQMRGQVAAMVQTRQPVVMGLLFGGGKMANPLKSGGVALPDLAEWHALTLLSALPRAVAELYPPGAHVIASPDAVLHSADLGLLVHGAQRHWRQLQADLKWLGIADVVQVPDVLQFLPDEWDGLVTANAREAQQRRQRDPEFALDALAQSQSLQYSINSQVLGLSYEELTLGYGAIPGPLPGMPAAADRLAVDLIKRAYAITPHYIGVNWAIRQAELIKRMAAGLFDAPLHLRLSVHAKPGNPRPALFKKNRVVPSLELFPMHALGVWQDADGESKFGLAFDLSGRVRGWTPLEWHGRMIGYEARPEPASLPQPPAA